MNHYDVIIAGGGIAGSVTRACRSSIIHSRDPGIYHDLGAVVRKVVGATHHDDPRCDQYRHGNL